jgi:hypothetical protein
MSVAGRKTVSAPIAHDALPNRQENSRMADYKQEGDDEFWVVFNYSEWLDAQGVIVANDDRSHWQLVQQWQTEKRAKEAGE